MRLPFFNRKSESLIETVVAITVIVLATTASLSMIRVSVSGNRVIAEKVIAINLALEAIEAVKNIRDTNYLNFSSNTDDCWDAIDANSVSDCNTTATRMQTLDGKTWFLERNWLNESLRLKWTLLNAPAVLENLSYYSILDDAGGTVNIYAESGLGYLLYSSFTLIEDDVFKRRIVFSNTSDNQVDVTATVEWEQKGEIYSVSLTRTISNVY